MLCKWQKLNMFVQSPNSICLKQAHHTLLVIISSLLFNFCGFCPWLWHQDGDVEKWKTRGKVIKYWSTLRWEDEKRLWKVYYIPLHHIMLHFRVNNFVIDVAEKNLPIIDSVRVPKKNFKNTFHVRMVSFEKYRKGWNFIEFYSKINFSNNFKN
jgi:hypothetical protein